MYDWLPHIEANLRLQKIAEILGEERMKEAEGDHAEAVRELKQDYLDLEELEE